MEANARPLDVVDLLSSSSEDESDIGASLQHLKAPQLDSDSESEAGEEEEPYPPMAGAFPPEIADATWQDQRPQERQANGGMIILIDDEEVFIPDEEPQAALATDPFVDPSNRYPNESLASGQPHREFTAEDCLHHVLEIFPDISHDHVRNLFASFDADSDFEILDGRARLDNIVEQLVSATAYPKQEKGKLKRKREDSMDDAKKSQKWERSDRGPVPNWEKGPILAICKAEYPSIPKQHIGDRFNTHQNLFQTFVALAKDVDDNEEGNRIFGKGRATKNASPDADTIAVSCGVPEIVEELTAARAKVALVRSQCEAARAKRRVEEENLQRAIAAGETTECTACFDNLPMNRQIQCDGPTAHFTCFECAETYIKTEVGDSRCKVLCPAGCSAGFAYNQLNLLENKQLLEKLAQLKQEQDIRDACLDDLEECPFCDFKAIMPPIEEDFEFRCANPECERVSCRRCKAVSHIPISCEQHAKDNKLSSRHQIEEAMTAALIRTCNKCRKVFIKESGCNKMHCMSCGTLQCYCCGETIGSYEHFNEGPGRSRTASSSKKCPLYDNVEERHEREVKEAEVKARAEIVEQNPDIRAEDLQIRVSDAIKKAEADKIKRNGLVLGGHANGYAGPFADERGMGRMAGLARDILRRPRRERDEDEDENDIAINEILGQAAARVANIGQVAAIPGPGRRVGEEVGAMRQLRDGAEEWDALFEFPFGQALDHARNGGENAAALPHGHIPLPFDHEQRQQQGPQPPRAPQVALQGAIRNRLAPAAHRFPPVDVDQLRAARAAMHDFRQAPQQQEPRAQEAPHRIVYPNAPGAPHPAPPQDLPGPPNRNAVGAQEGHPLDHYTVDNLRAFAALPQIQRPDFRHPPLHAQQQQNYLQQGRQQQQHHHHHQQQQQQQQQDHQIQFDAIRQRQQALMLQDQQMRIQQMRQRQAMERRLRPDRVRDAAIHAQRERFAQGQVHGQGPGPGKGERRYR